MMITERISERLADIIRNLDWVAIGLSVNGIECAEVALAASELAEIKLDLERQQFAAAVAA